MSFHFARGGRLRAAGGIVRTSFSAAALPSGAEEASRHDPEMEGELTGFFLSPTNCDTASAQCLNIHGVLFEQKQCFKGRAFFAVVELNIFYLL